MGRAVSTDGRAGGGTTPGHDATRGTRGPLPRSRLSLAAPLFALTLLLSACSVFSPAQTEYPYTPGDGVALDIGGVELENLVVVTPRRGATGVLVGQAVNETPHPVEVTVALTGGGPPATISLAPREADGITSNPANVELGPVPDIPGSMVELDFSTSAAGHSTVLVPVLPPGPDLDYYEGIGV